MHVFSFAVSLSAYERGTVAATFQVGDVEELLALMEQWSIAELHLMVGDDSLDLVRSVVGATAVEAVPSMPAPVAQIAAPAEAAPEPVTIFAPVVGVFHLATRGFPHRVPQPGDNVQAGQSIGSIELMRIPTDLVSPVSGTIEAILAEDGSGVEYGQPLMVIRPFEEVNEDEAGMLPPPPR